MRYPGLYISFNTPKGYTKHGPETEANEVTIAHVDKNIVVTVLKQLIVEGEKHKQRMLDKCKKFFFFFWHQN